MAVSLPVYTCCPYAIETVVRGCGSPYVCACGYVYAVPLSVSQPSVRAIGIFNGAYIHATPTLELSGALRTETLPFRRTGKSRYSGRTSSGPELYVIVLILLLHFPLAGCEVVLRMYNSNISTGRSEWSHSWSLPACSWYNSWDSKKRTALSSGVEG